MFGKQENKKTVQLNGGEDRNFIGSTSKFVGKIVSAGDFRIDGTLEGDLETTAKVALGPGSEVSGNIIAQNAEIEGTVTGVLRISGVLTLKATAVVSGEIFCGKLVVQPDAEFNGTVKMGDQNISAGNKANTNNNVSKNNAQKAKQKQPA